MKRKRKSMRLTWLIGTTRIERITAKAGLILAVTLSLIAILNTWQR